MNDYAEEIRRRWIKDGMPERKKTPAEMIDEVKVEMGKKLLGVKDSEFVWQRGPTVLK